jgi:hypothetical protein
LGLPDLIREYFIDEYSKLLLEGKKNWLIHDLVPEPEALFVLSKNINPARLSPDDMAFLWCSAHSRSSEIAEWCLNNEPFPFDFLFQYLRKANNTSSSLISEKDNIDVLSAHMGTNE